MRKNYGGGLDLYFSVYCRAVFLHLWPTGRTVLSISPECPHSGSCHQQRLRPSLTGSVRSRVRSRSVSYGHVTSVGLFASVHDQIGDVSPH